MAFKEIPRHAQSRYRPVLLDHLFGAGNYTLYSVDVDPDFVEEIDRYTSAIRNTNKICLVNQKNDSCTALEVHDRPGWMTALEEEGIHIKAGKKSPKRITVLHRDAYLACIRDFRNGDEPVNMVQVAPDHFSDFKVGDKVTMYLGEGTDRDSYERRELEASEAAMFLDGANVVSRELLEEMIDQGARYIERHAYNPNDVAVNVDVEKAAISGSIRILFPDGQIKGDYLLSDRESMARALGDDMPDDMDYVDVIYVADNLKDEVTWEHGYYCLLEPHGAVKQSDMQEGIAHTFTNQQSLCWLEDFLFPKQDLECWMTQYFRSVMHKMQSGYIPDFYKKHSGLEDNMTTVSRFQRLALEFERYGLGVNSSIFLLNRVMDGVAASLEKDAAQMRLPVACSMYVHVATDSWLRACGRDPEDWPNGKGFTERGHVWYDPQTHRLVYHDLDFVEDYPRHGGFDLDDALIAHARTYKGHKVFVNVRSPNSFGEYSIRFWSPDSFYPVWSYEYETADGTLVQGTEEWPEIPDDRPLMIDEIENNGLIEYDYTSLSFARPIDSEEYDRDFIIDRMQSAAGFFGLFGQYVNSYMIYHYIFKSFRPHQLAPLEEVVDAYAQDQSKKAADLIRDAIKELNEEIKQASHSGKPVDEALWRRRGNRRISGVRTTFDSIKLTEMTTRNLITSITDELSKQSQLAVNRIPDVMLDLGNRHKSVAGRIIAMARRVMNPNITPSGEGQTRGDVHGEMNDEIVNALFANDRSSHEVYDIMLSIAAISYSTRRNGRYNDTILFQQTVTVGNVDLSLLYIEALRYYDIMDWREDPDNYYTTYDCPYCEESYPCDNPLVKQDYGYHPCPSCGEVLCS